MLWHSLYLVTQQIFLKLCEEYIVSSFYALNDYTFGRNVSLLAVSDVKNNSLKSVNAPIEIYSLNFIATYSLVSSRLLYLNDVEEYTIKKIIKEMSYDS